MIRTGFNPLWINTALKQAVASEEDKFGFNPLWINTALKLDKFFQIPAIVSIPYGLTLLSNP